MTRPEHGFALLIVLWVLVFLAFLMTQMLGTGRGAVNLAENLRAAAVARAADDGAINTEVLHLLSTGTAHWPADGQARLAPVGALPVAVSARSLGGMVNPNTASAALLGALMQAAGADPDQANAIAANIVAWRTPPATPTAAAAAVAAYRAAGQSFAPPGRAFATLGELTDVLGMTPGLYAQIAPHMSLFQPGDPDPTIADQVVKKALVLDSGGDADGGAFEGAPVVAITACVPGALCRQAVVSLAGLGTQNPFQILALDTAPAAPQ